MELRKVDNTLINGLGKAVDIEETYLFSLLKGSDVAQNRIKTTERYILVTQRLVGESTDQIQYSAPKTWKYLEAHAEYLNKRNSKIYQHNHRFLVLVHILFNPGKLQFVDFKNN